MTDSVYTFKVIVVGTLLGCAIGQNYLFQNYRITPRRNNKFYVRQSSSQPRVIFAGNNGFGFRVTQLPRGAFALRHRSGHPAFRPKPLGSLVGGSTPRPPVKTDLQGLGTDPALTTTHQDQQKLIDFLVNVIIQSQKRKNNGKSTSPSPVLPVGEGSHLMTYTLPKGPHLLQKHTLSEDSNIPTHTLFKDAHVPTHSQHKGSQLPPTNTLSGSSHVPTHIHPFQKSGSENSVSTVIVHSHGPGQSPHVHIVNLNASNSPFFSGIGYHRHNTIHTSLPNILQISLPNPLMPDLFDKLPHFLTGGVKKEVLTKSVNITLLTPTKIPIVPVRLQILPPSQSTQPTRSLTTPESSPVEPDKQDREFEGAGDGPINSVTKISEPDSQIPSPRWKSTLASTTPVTVVPATTPTTTPGVLVMMPLTPTSVTPVTIPLMTSPVVPVTSPTTTIVPRATISPTTTHTNPTTTLATPTTTPTTPITEPIPSKTNLTPNIYPNSL